MPLQIWVVLIPALASIMVAVIALLRQILTDRTKRRVAQAEVRQDANDDLFREYRNLLVELRKDLAAEREAHHEAAEERDRWRREADAEKRRIERWLIDREK